MTVWASPLRIGVLLPVADLYHRLWSDIDETLERLGALVAGRFREAALEVSCSPTVSLPEAVAATCMAFAGQEVDLVLVALGPYCPSGVLAPALAESRLPVLLWPMQNILRLEPDRYNAEAVKLNHGVQGVQDLANVLGKTGRPFGVIHGHYQQPGFVEQLQVWAQAGRILRSMLTAHPVQVGDPFEHMLDLQVGQDEFVRRLGIVPAVISAPAFADLAAAVPKSQIAACVERYRQTFEIAEQIPAALLTKTGRGEAALRTLLQQAGSSACGLNFVELCNHRRVADSLHVASSMLLSEGLGYAGEGDWVTAVLVRGLQQGFGAASFSEIFSIGYEDRRLLLKRWGEGNFRLARARPRLLKGRLADRGPAEFALADFEFEPGPATLVNLNSTAAGQGQLLTIGGRIHEDHLPQIIGPRAIFQPDGDDVSDLLTAYAYAGGSHHLALVPAAAGQALERLCRLAGWVYYAYPRGKEVFGTGDEL